MEGQTDMAGKVVEKFGVPAKTPIRKASEEWIPETMVDKKELVGRRFVLKRIIFNMPSKNGFVNVYIANMDGKEIGFFGSSVLDSQDAELTMTYTLTTGHAVKGDFYKFNVPE